MHARRVGAIMGTMAAVTACGSDNGKSGSTTGIETPDDSTIVFKLKK